MAYYSVIISGQDFFKINFLESLFKDVIAGFFNASAIAARNRATSIRDNVFFTIIAGWSSSGFVVGLFLNEANSLYNKRVQKTDRWLLLNLFQYRAQNENLYFEPNDPKTSTEIKALLIKVFWNASLLYSFLPLINLLTCFSRPNFVEVCIKTLCNPLFLRTYVSSNKWSLSFAFSQLINVINPSIFSPSMGYSGDSVEVYIISRKVTKYVNVVTGDNIVAWLCPLGKVFSFPFEAYIFGVENSLAFPEIVGSQETQIENFQKLQSRYYKQEGISSGYDQETGIYYFPRPRMYSLGQKAEKSLPKYDNYTPGAFRGKDFQSVHIDFKYSNGLIWKIFPLSGKKNSPTFFPIPYPIYNRGLLDRFGQMQITEINPLLEENVVTNTDFTSDNALQENNIQEQTLPFAGDLGSNSKQQVMSNDDNGGKEKQKYIIIIKNNNETETLPQQNQEYINVSLNQNNQEIQHSSQENTNSTSWPRLIAIVNGSLAFNIRTETLPTKVVYDFVGRPLHLVQRELIFKTFWTEDGGFVEVCLGVREIPSELPRNLIVPRGQSQVNEFVRANSTQQGLNDYLFQQEQKQLFDEQILGLDIKLANKIAQNLALSAVIQKAQIENKKLGLQLLMESPKSGLFIECGQETKNYNNLFLNKYYNNIAANWPREIFVYMLRRLPGNDLQEQNRLSNKSKVVVQGQAQGMTYNPNSVHARQSIGPRNPTLMRLSNLVAPGNSTPGASNLFHSRIQSVQMFGQTKAASNLLLTPQQQIFATKKEGASFSSLGQIIFAIGLMLNMNIDDLAHKEQQVCEGILRDTNATNYPWLATPEGQLVFNAVTAYRMYALVKALDCENFVNELTNELISDILVQSPEDLLFRLNRFIDKLWNLDAAVNIYFFFMKTCDLAEYIKTNINKRFTTFERRILDRVRTIKLVNEELAEQLESLSDKHKHQEFWREIEDLLKKRGTINSSDRAYIKNQQAEATQLEKEIQSLQDWSKRNISLRQEFAIQRENSPLQTTLIMNECFERIRAHIRAALRKAGEYGKYLPANIVYLTVVEHYIATVLEFLQGGVTISRLLEKLIRLPVSDNSLSLSDREELKAQMNRVTLKADFTERERIIAQTQLQRFIFIAFVKECNNLSKEDQDTLELLMFELEDFDDFCRDFRRSNLSDDELKEKAESYNDLFDKLRTLQAQNAVNILKPLPESTAGYRSYPDKNHETLNDFNVVQSCIAMFEELRSNFESPNPNKPVSEVERKKYKELCDFLISTAARIQKNEVMSIMKEMETLFGERLAAKIAIRTIRGTARQNMIDQLKETERAVRENESLLRQISVSFVVATKRVKLNIEATKIAGVTKVEELTDIQKNKIALDSICKEIAEKKNLDDSNFSNDERANNQKLLESLMQVRDLLQNKISVQEEKIMKWLDKEGKNP